MEQWVWLKKIKDKKWEGRIAFLSFLRSAHPSPCGLATEGLTA